MTNRKLRYSGLGLAALTVGAIAACSSDGGTPAGGGGSGTAGTYSNGGSGGVPGAGGGATAGTATTAGTAGTTTAGGAGGAAGFACPTTMLTNPLITGFTNTAANATSPGNFTVMDGVPGGTFSYQANALTLTINTDTALNIKGNVKAYDGFGVYFNGCNNASGFTGVSFKIKGYAGPKGKLNFRVQTNANTAIDTANSKGACVVPSGTMDTYPLCHASSFDIPVTATTQTISVLFSQLKDGVPVPTVTGADVVGLEWAFDWTPAPAGAAGAGAGGAASGGGSGGASAGGAGGSAGKGGGSTAAGGSGGAAPAAGPYDADVTIDDITFTGGSVPVGGSGGTSAGGASAGGAGGASAGGPSTGGTGGATAGGSGGKAGSGG